MAMYNLNPLPKDDIAEDGEEREDSRHSRFAINDQKGDIIYFQAVCEMPYSSTILICVSDNDDLVSSIDELGGKLIYMAFNSSRLREKKVADHCDIVRHGDVLKAIMGKMMHKVSHLSSIFLWDTRPSRSLSTLGISSYGRPVPIFNLSRIDKSQHDPI